MEKSVKILLKTTGIISVLFLLLHIMFFKLFNWPATLACLEETNRAIFLTFNLVIILQVFSIAFFALFRTKELLTKELGHPLLIFFTLFYLIRIFAEFLYFGFSGMVSIIIIVLCLIPCIAFMMAFLHSAKIS